MNKHQKCREKVFKDNNALGELTGKKKKKKSVGEQNSKYCRKNNCKRKKYNAIIAHDSPLQPMILTIKQTVGVLNFSSKNLPVAKS